MKSNILYFFGAIITAFFAICLVPTAAEAATSFSACGTLSTNSETYNLTQNIGTGGDCIIVAGDNIVINLAGSTVTGNINGNGVFGGSHKGGYIFTVSNGTVTGNITSRGADGRPGTNGGNGGNGNNAINNGGSGLGGVGGTASTDGSGAVGVAGNPGADGFDNDTAGDGGNGANGGLGEAGSSGGILTLSSVTVGGDIHTGGGNGGRGGDAGNGGNGGVPNGNGGSGGMGGQGGNSGRGRHVNITNSRIVGTITTSSGNTGNGGNGGNGGNADMTSLVAIAGAGQNAGVFGSSVLESGTFSVVDSTIVGPITTRPGVCGLDGRDGVSGTALDPSNVPASPTSGGACGGQDTLPSSAYTVVDNPPYSISLIGPAVVSLLTTDSYIEQGVTLMDVKDGALTTFIPANNLSGGAGTYVLTYNPFDLGTTLVVNGQTVTYQAPQTLSIQRTIVVSVPPGIAGGSPVVSSGFAEPSGATSPTSPVIPERAIRVCSPGEKFNTITGKPCVQSASPAPFNKNLYLKMRHDDVKRLQIFLNSNGFPIAKTGVGSIGKEGDYFGPATRAALIKFQASSGIKPSDGHFGPITRSFINAIVGK